MAKVLLLGVLLLAKLEMEEKVELGVTEATVPMEPQVSMKCRRKELMKW